MAVKEGDKINPALRNPFRMTRASKTIGACAGVALAGIAYLAQEPRPLRAAATPATSAQRAIVDRYCVTCHNQKLRTAGLSLDTLDIGDVGKGAPAWENVIHQIRAGAMPPAG